MATRQGFRGYDDPLKVVDRTEIDYTERLAILQDWLAEIGKAEAPDAERRAVEAAIRALETGAVVQDDQAAEAPDAHGYGVAEERTGGPRE